MGDEMSRDYGSLNRAATMAMVHRELDKFFHPERYPKLTPEESDAVVGELLGRKSPPLFIGVCRICNRQRAHLEPIEALGKVACRKCRDRYRAEHPDPRVRAED